MCVPRLGCSPFGCVGRWPTRRISWTLSIRSSRPTSSSAPRPHTWPTTRDLDWEQRSVKQIFCTNSCICKYIPTCNQGVISLDLQTVCPKVAIEYFWGVLFFKGDHIPININFYFWKPKKRKQAFFVYFPARRAQGYAIKHLQHVTVCIMVCWITVRDMWNLFKE